MQSRRAKPDTHRLSIPARLGIGAGACLLKGLLATLRVRVEDAAGVLEAAREGPLIFCFWHNQMLLAPWFYTKHLRPRAGVVLTSPSRDGAYLDEVVRHFGLRAVRGSSSRRGLRAMLELLDALRDGAHLGITPDGPRGPRYVCGPGAIFLSQRSGRPIAPLHVYFAKAWRLKSWDGFFIPKPFSGVTISLSTLMQVPPEMSDDDFERQRQTLEDILKQKVFEKV